MNLAICLMGPTASGKTEVAVSLRKRFPIEIISVDSAMVYRGLDIGTAKPDRETLLRAPHRLIDIREPEERYSAGDFVRDAHREMRDIWAAGRVPLLVGGTMMYFRSLTAGIAELPGANPQIRAKIEKDAEKSGWPALHERLKVVDPIAAGRINPNDSQRIQRALEVYLDSDRPLTEWQTEAGDLAPADVRFLKMALFIRDRSVLHERIEGRLKMMFNNGLLDEVRALYERPSLIGEHPSMRSVGYRQVWEYLEGASTLEEARAKALYATRQLAKRQVTWLRRERDVVMFDPLESVTIDAMSKSLIEFLDA
jgi:tRNA dimethylallyltransferase